MFLPTHKKLQRGYTLIEMLVVFSLVIIISSVSFASYSSYAQHQTVNQAAADVKLAFSKARFNALSQVKPSECDDTNQLLGYKVILSGTKDYSIVAHCKFGSPPPAPEDDMHLPGNLTFSNTDCSGVEFSTLNNSVSIPPGCNSFDISLNDSIKKTLAVGSNGIITISP